MNKYIVYLTQREIDTLWMVSRSIGGSPSISHRKVFSDTYNRDCITAKFRKIVSQEAVEIVYNGGYMDYIIGSVIFNDK